MREHFDPHTDTHVRSKRRLAPSESSLWRKVVVEMERELPRGIA